VRGFLLIAPLRVRSFLPKLMTTMRCHLPDHNWLSLSRGNQ
jgi:hypothetical protein